MSENGGLEAGAMSAKAGSRDELLEEVLSSVAEIGKRWGFELPIGRIWAFLLFQPRAVTQREIEQGTGYSRGLISRTLRKMAAFSMIRVFKEGKEMKYAVNLSLTDGFNDFLKRLLNEKIKPMIELLSENLEKVEDEALRKTFSTLISEYQRLRILITAFSKILDDIKAGKISEKDVERWIERENGATFGNNERR